MSSDKGVSRIANEIKALIKNTSAIGYAVAPRLKKQTLATFDKKTDPYGEAWERDVPATFKRGTKSENIRSGKMRSLFDVLPVTDAKMIIHIGAPYARYNISTGRRPLPKKGVLPPVWKAEIEHVIDSVTKAFNAR